jgi:hypothetical protein
VFGPRERPRRIAERVLKALARAAGARTFVTGSASFDRRLERAIAVLLMSIGALLIGERSLQAGQPALVPADPGAQKSSPGFVLSLCIRTAAGGDPLRLHARARNFGSCRGLPFNV